MNIAFDIDDTITKKPEFFLLLSRAVTAAGGKVLIISSRSDTFESRCKTLKELDGYGIAYTELHLIADADVAREKCPHKELGWWEMFLWQKVDICLQNNVQVLFEDDEQVIALVREYAPDIQVFQAV